MTEEHRPGTPADLPAAGAGAHKKAPDEAIRSRSADPGQSSYGGFSGEDPRRQSQDLPETDADKGKDSGRDKGAAQARREPGGAT